MLFKPVFLTIALAAYGLAAPAAEAAVKNTLVKRIDHTGVATYYEQNGGTGSCGEVHQESDLIIALSPSWQGSGYPPTYCNRKIQIKNLGGGQNNPGTGNVIVATVKDTCPGCDSNHLDLSHGAFQALTNGNLDPPGKFNIVWHFCNVNGQC